MNRNRKCPSKLELGFHAWISYNVRFIMDGDLASAWETFGGVAMQPTHLGAVLNLPIPENATIEMTYGQKIRTYADELSKFRTRKKDIIYLLKEEDRRIKSEVIRECGPTATFAHRNSDVKRKKDKQNDWKCNGKGRKCKGRKVQGENKFRG